MAFDFYSVIGFDVGQLEPESLRFPANLFKVRDNIGSLILERRGETVSVLGLEYVGDGSSQISG